MNLQKGFRSPKVGNRPQTLVSDHAESIKQPLPTAKPTPIAHNNLPVVHMNKVAFYKGFEKQAGLLKTIGRGAGAVVDAGKRLISGTGNAISSSVKGTTGAISTGISDLKKGFTQAANKTENAAAITAQQTAKREKDLNNNILKRESRINQKQKARDATAQAAKDAKKSQQNPGDAAASMHQFQQPPPKPQPTAPVAKPNFYQANKGAVHMGGAIAGGGTVGYMAGRNGQQPQPQYQQKFARFITGFNKQSGLLGKAVNILGQGGVSLARAGKNMVAKDATSMAGKTMQNVGGFVAKNRKPIAAGTAAVGAGFGVAKMTNGSNNNVPQQ